MIPEVGRPSSIITDHGALGWLLRFKNPEGQLAILKVMEVTAVSYTHLDVYKRQAEYGGIPIAGWWA